MSTLDFLVAINGIGQLWATDGQFLGLLSSDQNDLNSINNLYGVYGSQKLFLSIRSINRGSLAVQERFYAI